jgi:hypothetical protein
MRFHWTSGFKRSKAVAESWGGRRLVIRVVSPSQMGEEMIGWEAEVRGSSSDDGSGERSTSGGDGREERLSKPSIEDAFRELLSTSSAVISDAFS